MKTEQEQIKEIMETLLAHEPIIDVPYEKINEIAVVLGEEGYGDISEYKAEIERLKAENDSLNKKISELEQDLIHADENVFYRECDVKLAEDKIKKQAQIDVLSKVKDLMDKYYVFEGVCGYFIDDFKELIEEIEK